ncbi:MAG TPA: adenylate/guanylate cyclase domain-containing protein [Solirubrobacteraceae bacterium]|nr:adenylate/guanylate cyclase domain-containing protein [Solirubrobacteraceae bacterium]
MSASIEWLPDESERHSAAWWLDAVRREERRGELLSAFDLAERGLAQHPDDLALKHRAVLALARTGATEEAARRFGRYGLSASSEEDVSALQARIAKDIALACEAGERRRRATSAAELYNAIFARTGGYYPAINAATLWLIAGDPARARRLAASVLDILRTSGDRSYWAAATEAEARLLRREPGLAARALQRAATSHESDYAALATTRRQLRMICEVDGIDPAILAALSGPGVVHYCGHRIGVGEPPRFAAEAEAAVARRVKEAVERHAPGYAYGSLAGGADILWAEALLGVGAELHVVLPFARVEFVEESVAPGGAAWVERFDRCLSSATSIRFATDDAYRGDEVLFRYGSELAMGLALLRASYLDADVHQLTVWDRGPAHGAAGTALDVATWVRRGRGVTLVRPGSDAPVPEDIDPAAGTPLPSAVETDRRRGATPESARQGSALRRATSREARIVRAMLFADVKGFSVLTDEQVLIFAERVLGDFAGVLQRHRSHVCHRRTWGDAVFLVLADASTAADCALDLQEAMSSIDLESEGLPGHLALRLGAHLGPIFRYHDPVLDSADFTGSHVSRTARIEPITPAGEVYVSEPFAAALVLADRRDLTCDYVGHMPMAKGYGRLRMYRLRRFGPETAEV